MPRNRPQTEQRILSAALERLRASGFEDWGINAVARHAGVDKVLIYRYFNSLDGLLASIVKATAFWPAPEALPDDSATACLEAIIHHFRERPEIPVLLSQRRLHAPPFSVARQAVAQWNAVASHLQLQVHPRPSREALLNLQALLLRGTLFPGDALAAHALWRVFSSDAEWRPHAGEAHADKELPTELL